VRILFKAMFDMAQNQRLLIVDDDDALREALAEQFAVQGEFNLSLAANAGEALALIAGARVDMVLLDVNLPDMDGRDACKLLRSQGYAGPVILLTAQDSETDMITGLDSGANDYVTKPFRFSVLQARIRAQLRAASQSEQAVFSIGPYLFKPAAKALITADGKKIRLTEKETAILRHLHRAGKQVVARDVLLHEIWGYNPSVSTHTLETHIYRLRQKMETAPSQAVILLTEAGGYKLIP
jgi:DNA-binding response OmpR family regulator